MIVYPHYIRNCSQWHIIWQDKQPHIYSRPTIRRSYLYLISGYSRPILGRSYADLISGYSMLILFPHSAKCVRDCGQSHHGCRQNKLLLLWNALLTTSNNIINICFWLLETCTKCSYFIEKYMRPGAQRLAFEVKFKYITYRSTNILWAGGLRLGKFPDNRRLMC